MLRPRRTTTTTVVGERAQVAGMRSHDHVERVGDVADASGHHAARRQVMPAGRAAVGRRHPPERGLEARHRRRRGRDADRPATVGPRGERHHPRRQRGRGPARRATGCAFEVPRVAGDAERGVVGLGLQAELGGVGLPDHDGTRVLETRDEHRVAFGRWVAGVGRGPVRGHEARRVLQVLHADGDPGQGAHDLAGPHASIDVVGGRERAVRVDRNEGVHLAVQALDPC